MTQPTQELPPYLSASTFVVTSDGAVSTGVSTVEVPLTYFGPSIPLGSGDVWVFGGSTSPPSTAETTTAIPSSSISSIPLSSSMTSIVTQTSPSSISISSIISSTSATPSISSATSSAPITSGSASIPASTSKSTVRRALPGIIIGSIIGLLLILALIVYLLYRRNRRYRVYDQANLSDFVLVDNDGQTRVAGEGVARPTGGEEDPFLSRDGPSADAAAEAGEAVATTAAIGVAEPHSGGEPSHQTPMSQIRSIFKGNSLFATSGASIFYNPNVPAEQPLSSEAQHRPLRDSSSTHPSSIPSLTPPPPPPPRGPIMPARQLIDLDAEWQKEPHQEYMDTSGPSLPPGLPARPIYPHSPVISEHGERLTNPSSENVRRISAAMGPDVSVEAAGGRGIRFNPDGSFQTSAPNRTFRSSGMSALTTDIADESFSFPSARRVVLSETAPGQYVTLPPTAPQNRRISALSFGSFARLSPLSWLQSSANSRSRSRPRTQSRPGSALGRPLTDAELQAGRAVLMAARPGDRPVSYVSAHSMNSGNSVYHDAASTFSSHAQSRPPTPATGSTPTPPLPLPVPPVPSPPPIATSTPLRSDFDLTSGSIPNPPVYAPSPPAPVGDAASHSSGNAENPSGVTIDILDTPAPPSVSPYSSTSSRGGPTLPPGLGHFPAPRVWRESSSDMPPPASLGSGQSDNLEDEPPRAGNGWTNLRTTVGLERRTTLGQPVISYGSPAHSEIASLHSIPSRRSPLASSASGSNPHLVSPHSRYNAASLSSGSSRPSIYSHIRSVNTSGSSSLQHSNSISSDGRRGARREVGEPAAAQYAIGSNRPRLSALGGRSTMSSPLHSPPTVPEATFAAALGAASTITTDDASSARSGSLATTTTTTMVDAQTGAVMHFPTVVWTSGREVDWPSDAWTEIPDSSGARWWGPPHRLQSFQRAAGERRQRTARDDLQRYT